MNRNLLRRAPSSTTVAVALGVAATVLAPCLAAPPKAAKKAQSQQQRQRAGLPAAVTADPPSTIMEVAAVDRSGRSAVHQAAAKIDSLLASSWKEHGVEASVPLKDEQFLRRIYLDLGGRIPTYEEATRFLASKAETKRADLIDNLLESPDYVSHFYNYWADILRLLERPQKTLFFEPYLWYVKDSIRTNKPFDGWAHEMLTADGRVWDNPAVGFQLRDAGMPLPYVDNTVRVLLGTQIGCAQCHDHPFDDWTQHQFYELAAFTSGTQMRGRGKNKNMMSRQMGQAGARELIQEAKQKLDRPTAFVQFVAANTTAVSFAEAPLKLPHDYQYEDAEPLAVVSPKVLWGEIPSGARDADGREQFASWVISRDNRQFARTIANRMWKKVMGVGLVEPVDDFQPGNPPSNPELLEHLTDEMLRLDFDLREFVRILVSTGTYQRRAVVYDPASGTPFRFTGPALRRMTAEQIWDSILTLVAHNAWAVQRPTAAEVAAAVNLDLANPSFDAAYGMFERFAKEYTPPRRMRELQQTVGYRGQLLVRASEMPAPLPLGHFLRQFGQSDRETIEGARTVATVPQILTMFNGQITHSMLEKGSVIYDTVVAHTPQEAIDVIFLSVLSHKPSGEDRKLARDEIMTADTPAAGYGNLIWALLNTREFIFIQ
ncbi:MAG: DUF1549 and DUF1553 domain-containing protein [Planctomycetota bacterium]|nr:DUF1549 and DUF1553 domain-containing protein [Planctomycetota bacterium]